MYYVYFDINVQFCSRECCPVSCKQTLENNVWNCLLLKLVGQHYIINQVQNTFEIILCIHNHTPAPKHPSKYPSIHSEQPGKAPATTHNTLTLWELTIHKGLL